MSINRYQITGVQLEVVVTDDGEWVGYAGHAAELAARDATIARMAEALKGIFSTWGCGEKATRPHFLAAKDSMSDSASASALAWLSAQKREAAREALDSLQDRLEAESEVVLAPSSVVIDLIESARDALRKEP